MRHRFRFAVAVLSLVTLTTVSCATAVQYRGGHHPLVRGRVVFIGGYYYDPFFGPYPWWQPALYPRAYFPVFDERAQVRVLVTPKNAAVYVDGFYAGVVDDFDGFLQWLPLPPGGHEVVLYLNGYRTDRQMVHLEPASRLEIRLTLERLAPGEDSERPRIAPMVPPPPPGTFKSPSTPQPSSEAQGPPPSAELPFGIRVEWSSDIDVRDGDTTPFERELIAAALGQ